MGRAKDAWMEMQEIENETKIAEKLGLTHDELQETEWHIERDESKDGLLYQYIVYFGDIPKKIKKKIIGLNSDNQVWIEPYEMEDDEYYDEDYYDYKEQFDAIIDNKHYYDSFRKEIINLEKLNTIVLESKELENVLKRQLYVSAIGTLETFLSETFINQTDEKPEYFKKFVETFPDFAKQKFQLNEILTQYEILKNTVRKAMLEVIYHNLDKVQKMYSMTFNIQFPNIAELSKCVAKRHDLVHRNGKTKEGEEILIDGDIIAELLEKILKLVEEISISLNLKA